jgi:hypothetical protein
MQEYINIQGEVGPSYPHGNKIQAQEIIGFNNHHGNLGSAAAVAAVLVAATTNPSKAIALTNPGF